MAASPRQFDWHTLLGRHGTSSAISDPIRRLRVMMIAFVALIVVLLGRAVQLEATSGDAYRAEAAKPRIHQRRLPGIRGRILSRDGRVLARDEITTALAVSYFVLINPPDDQFAERVAGLCDITSADWDRRAKRIGDRVGRIADHVNDRRMNRYRDRQTTDAEPPLKDQSLWHRVAGAVVDALFAPPEELPPPRIRVLEETEDHVIAEGLSIEAVAEIEGHPRRYPGCRIVQRSRRIYPAGELAAHTVGFLGVVGEEELKAASTEGATNFEPGDLIGRAGVERQYDALLRGRDGGEQTSLDRRGRVVSTEQIEAPRVGPDLILTLDARLQSVAQSLLAAALERRSARGDATAKTSGGAIVVMDVHSGALLAVASAPRFDPNVLVRRDNDQIRRLLTAKDRPLLDRAIQMTIPPGSVFKTVSALALLESKTVRIDETLHCQGYLHTPDRLRCYAFQRYGVGHGKLSLASALAQSCNVFFFHHAPNMGPAPLIDWSLRLGFGRPTGVDLPGESRGVLPTPINIESLERHPWRTGDTRALAIGQGSLAVTPLQIVRMMAAVANGGRLVTPHVAAELGVSDASSSAKDDRLPVPEIGSVGSINPATLAAVRAGLRQAVSDPQGTAHATVKLSDITVAGKTGTAETGGDRPPHAWLAGYAPAEAPRLAFVVVLEHAGGGSSSAGPVVRRLVTAMDQLQLLGRRRANVAADKPATRPM